MIKGYIVEPVAAVARGEKEHALRIIKGKILRDQATHINEEKDVPKEMGDDNGSSFGILSWCDIVPESNIPQPMGLATDKPDVADHRDEVD
jgi:hypothetical protein